MNQDSFVYYKPFLEHIFAESSLIKRVTYDFNEEEIICFLSLKEEPSGDMLRFCLPLLVSEKTQINQIHSFHPLCHFCILGKTLFLSICIHDYFYADAAWIQAIARMVLLSLASPKKQSLPSGESFLEPDVLFEHYEDREQFETHFVQITHHILERGEQKPKSSCDPVRYRFGVCCEKHRFLRAFQTQALEWQHFFYDYARKGESVSQYERQLLAASPSDIWEKGFLKRLLSFEQETMQEFVENDFQVNKLFDEKDWNYPMETCDFDRHIWNKCCSFHAFSCAVFNILSFWRAYRTDQYELWMYKDEDGRSVSLGSIAGWALFGKLAGIDWSSVPFTDWSKDIPECEQVEWYQRRETCG